jgi:hypothetical protein
MEETNEDPIEPRHSNVLVLVLEREDIASRGSSNGDFVLPVVAVPSFVDDEHLVVVGPPIVVVVVVAVDVPIDDPTSFF